jgi:signal peptidase I
MEPTLLQGDWLLFNRLVTVHAESKWVLLYKRRVKIGDLIIFRYHHDMRHLYVKRIIGMPHDRIRISDRCVYVNGRLLSEFYARHDMTVRDSYLETFPQMPAAPVTPEALHMLETNVHENEVVVPDGELFVLGDNREHSFDSRYLGFVSVNDLVGVANWIYWSYDSDACYLPTEAQGGCLWRGIRWPRAFHSLK